MKLGKEVLSKIQNLITQIDKPKRSQRHHTPTKQNMETREGCNRLYQEGTDRLRKKREVELNKCLKDRSQMSPFRITNPHTIFLNSQKQQLPLYKRLDQIRQKKEQDMAKLKELYPSKEQVEAAEEEEIGELMEQRRKSEHKYSKEEVAAKMQEMEEKEKLRREKISLLKLKTMEQYAREFKRKPYVGKESEALWHRHRLKKQLSTSVFERFEQYEMKRLEKLENRERMLRNTLTPFTPDISQTSRKIVSRSTSRSTLHPINMSRSHSCKCLSRSKSNLNRSTAVNTSRKP